MPKKILLAFLLALCLVGNAQNVSTDSVFTVLLQNDVLLPMLIDSAIKNSPELARAENNVKFFGENLQSSKKQIWNSLSFSSSYGYGNTGMLALEKDAAGIVQPNYNNIKSSRYSVGVGIQLSVGSLLSRKNTTRAAEIEIGMAEDELKSKILEVKQKVIKLYEDMKLSHSLLLITGKMKQSANISYSMSEKNFMNTQLTVEQFSTQQNQYYQSMIIYNNQLTAFETNLQMLESYSGVKLTKLISQVKK